MIQRRIINLHGFGTQGGLKNSKGQFFNQKFGQFEEIAFHAFDFNPTPKDFEFHTFTGMIDRLRQYIFDHNLNPVQLIGSSQGALAALNYAHRYGGVEKMLLLAPALYYDSSYASEKELQEWQEIQSAPIFHYGFGKEIPLNYGYHQDGLRYVNAPQPPAPIMIIHGFNDETIPIDRSRVYAQRYPDQVQLIEIDDDHLLRNQMNFIWEQAKLFFQLKESRT